MYVQPCFSVPTHVPWGAATWWLERLRFFLCDARFRRSVPAVRVIRVQSNGLMFPMSFRSMFLGLLAAVITCAFCYFNDSIIRAGTMTIPNLLPAVAYGGVVLFVLLLNPLLGRWRLGRREVAAALALYLISCGVPGWSLGEMFSGTVMFPHHDVRTTPSWASLDILRLAPEGALCDVSGSRGEDIALNGFISGLGQGDRGISPLDVPWGAWRGPFLFWGPLVFAFLLAVFGLSAVFHRQWSSHEQLPYPIVQFASSLLPTDGGCLSPTFRNRLFIVGFSVVFLLLFNNFCVRLWPEYFISVNLSFNMAPFSQLCPTVLRGKGGMLFFPQIIFTVVGLAYFLPSEASFSMWVGPWLYCLIGGVFAAYGTDLRAAKMMALVPEPFIFAGGYFGIFLIILYTGRHFYWQALRRALGFRGSQDDIPDYTILGMRLFLAGFLAFIALLHHAGVHWTVGLPYAVVAVMVYTVVSRVLAETGAFEIGTYVYPCVILWGLFGASALGPRVLVILFLLSTVLLAAPGWCVMPFVGQSLKLAQLNGVSERRTTHWGAVTMVIAVLVAIPATIYWQYSHGADTTSWPRASSIYPFANTVEVLQTLRAQGLEQTALARSGFEHLLSMSPDWTLVGAFAITTLLAIGCALGRLRYTWWPLHPVIFVFFGGHQAMAMSASFGLGFLLKWSITKYGGGRAYQSCKPLFIGAIAGTLCEQLVQMLIGIGHYLVTGTSI